LTRLSLSPGGYFLVSAHREENVDSPPRLTSLLECLAAVHEEFGLPVLVSTHPRTRRRLEELGTAATLDGVVFHEPFGFLDYNHLQLNAYCVLSDSGTISEESSILRFPAVTLRSSIERPEALDTGSIIMVDLDPGALVAGVRAATADHGQTATPRDYDVADCSIRVRNFILSTSKQHATWAGLR
jgi:UDP-N-acetylglucosamine 2-epimerase